MKKCFYSTEDGGKMFLWAVAVPQVFAIFVALIVSFIAGGTETALYDSIINNITFSVCYAMLAQLAFLLVYVCLNKKHNFMKASKISFNMKSRNIFLALLIGIIAPFMLFPFVSLGDSFLQFIGYHASTSLGLPLTNVWWLIANIVLLAVVPAILEELIFRGVILNAFKRLGALPCILLSATLFMLVHGTCEQTVYPFLFGLVLATVAYKTGNVLYSVIIHFISNFIVIMFSYFNLSLFPSAVATIIPFWLYIIIAISLLAMFFIGFFFLQKLFTPHSYELSNEQIEEMSEEQTKKNFGSNKYLYFGIILAVAIWILDFVTFMVVEK